MNDPAMPSAGSLDARKAIEAADGDPWAALRLHTAARIGLGRSGASLPTAPALAFSLAHARARDAVHAPFDADAVAARVTVLGHQTLIVQSRAAHRTEYLRRPDFGRRLADGADERLQAHRCAAGYDAAYVIADGLSAHAAEHAIEVLRLLPPLLDGWSFAPVVVAVQARVALGDAVAVALGARQVVVAIGERPGLSSPDSLGLYLTHDARPGCNDAQRNCISNVRPQGLQCAAAAARLAWLMREARRRRVTGVALKDDSGTAVLDDASTVERAIGADQRW